MPYGQGQPIGATIDPRLFVQDYSGFAKAGMIQGQGMASLGQSVGNAVGDVGKMISERKKEQAEQEKEIKMAENIAAMIETTMPDIAPQVATIRARISDKNLPLQDRHADAKSIMEVLNIGVEGKKLKMEQEELDIRRAASSGRTESPLSSPFPVPDGKGGSVMMQMDKGTGAIVPANIVPFDDPTLQDLPPLDENGDIIGDAAGMVLPPKGAIGGLGYEPPKAGAGGQIMDAGEMAKLAEQGLEFKAEPAGAGKFRVTEVKSAPAVPVPKGQVMTKEQVDELAKSGVDYTAEPVGDGRFRVTNIKGNTTNYDKMRDDVATARKLYEEGKVKEALDLMVAMRFSSPFGAAVDMNTLEMLWGPPGAMPDPADTPAPFGNSQPRVPLFERLKQMAK